MVASTPSGLIISTLFADTDITKHGSGNIGASNVTRVLSRELGLATLITDLLKGLVPTLFAQLMCHNDLLTVATAVAAFTGHCWSAYISFRGGKGVATAAGAMLVLAPFSTILSAVLWVTVMLNWKKASISSLITTAALPVLTLLIHPESALVATLISVGVIWRHRANIQRLRQGVEL